MQIPFNRPLVTGQEITYINDVISSKSFQGNGKYSRKVTNSLSSILNVQKVLFTTSCTHALEMVALLLDIQPGDEIIMPSYTFVSTANAFALRGAKIVFVDIHAHNMNINENCVLQAISSKTRAIVIVHYAGVACNMHQLTKIASEAEIPLIEDAAQCIGATYKGRHLGTFGDFGTLSFHETKNIHCGEGGALLINNKKYNDLAEIILEKGTNRSRFIRGDIAKYSWVAIGSSYIASELNAAFLFGQLDSIEKITKERKNICRKYTELLLPLFSRKLIEYNTDFIKNDDFNGHIFYIKIRNSNERSKLIDFLGNAGIRSAFHYVPLHSSRAGMTLGCFFGEDKNTSQESDRLLRLPLYSGLQDNQLEYVVDQIKSFYA